MIHRNKAVLVHKSNERGSQSFLTIAECLRCQFAVVAPLRSALHSYRTFTTRGLYFIDRCAERGL